jgi:hypothetical protein
MYFDENSEFPIKDALCSDEILHNGDLDFQGKRIVYNSFNDNENKVSLLSSPRNNVSLVVKILCDTYTSDGYNRVTDRRGNKFICGLLKRVNENKILIYRPLSLVLPDREKIIKTAYNRFTFDNILNSIVCKKMKACYEFLDRNNFDFNYFDCSGNRCYCSKCFPNKWINSQVIAGETYVIPRGWIRFGLKIPVILSQQNDVWNKWCNVFHGTNPEAAKSIIKHRTLLINKDIKSDGIRVGKNCSAEEWNNYYLTPHICYSSHPWYSHIIQIEPINGKRRYAQVVLACKIRYGIYQKQCETEGGLKEIFDDYSIIEREQIEWYSSKRGCVVPYGVLVRIFGKAKKRVVTRLA